MEKERKYYTELTKTKNDYKLFTKSFIMAFLGGGLLSIIGQVILNILNYFNKNDIDNNPLYLSLIMIFISAILTGIGVYDKLGQIFKCGFAIPITGFANSIVSPAMEYKSEGYVMGVGGKMFTVAGPVLVFGISASIIVGIVYLIFNTQSMTLV